MAAAAVPPTGGARVNAISPLAATATGDALRGFYVGKNMPDISHNTPDSLLPGDSDVVLPSTRPGQ
jgi:hypothetical protein